MKKTERIGEITPFTPQALLEGIDDLISLYSCGEITGKDIDDDLLRKLREEIVIE